MAQPRQDTFGSVHEATAHDNSLWIEEDGEVRQMVAQSIYRFIDYLSYHRLRRGECIGHGQPAPGSEARPACQPAPTE